MTDPLTTDAERVALAREYFPFFLGWVHKTDAPALFEGQAVPAAHHQEMIDALVEDEHGHTVIVMPRGSGKTTLVQAWVEWKLGRASLGLDTIAGLSTGSDGGEHSGVGATSGSPAPTVPKAASHGGGSDWANDFRVIWFSNTAHQAYRVSNAIKATIEVNEVYKAIFPKVKPHKEKWSQEEWKVAGNTIKDSTFLALGVGGPALGARALYIIYDDIADEENMKTPYQREQLVGVEDGPAGWLDNTAVPILVPWGRMIMSCTRWAWNDPAQWAIGREWHTLYRKALNRDDNDELISYWEDRFSVEWLLARQKENPRAFAKQYQNEVAPEEGLVFERIWFLDRFDAHPADPILSIGTLDTASGVGRNRSFSVNLSLRVTPDWHYYLTHMLRGQLAYDVLKETLVLIVSRFRYNALIVEGKDVGKAIIADLRNRGVNVFEFQPPGQRGSIAKEAADLTTATVAGEGRLHLPSDFYCRQTGDTQWLADFEHQLFSYPEGEQGEKSDVVMALKQGLCWLEDQRLRYQHLLAQPREPMRFGKPTSRKVMV